MRKKSIRLTPVILLLLLLTACGVRVSGAGPKRSEAPLTGYPDKPEPTPEPGFVPGERVIVDGEELPDSVELDGVLYVSLRGLCDLLGVELEEGAEYRFTWRKLPVEIERGSDKLVVDSELLDLEGRLLAHDREPVVPVCSFCRALKIGVLHDEEYQTWYFTPSAGDWALPAGYRVPVMMYHGVSDASWGNDVLFVPTSRMESQLAYLLEQGYQPIWFEDLEHIDEYDKPIILTFDDGYADNYTNLFPLLVKYQVKATIFVVTDWNWGLYLNDDMIREMVDSGLVSVQSHTRSHRRLSDLDTARQIEQMVTSKLAIARRTGRVPFVLCYPEGAATRSTGQLLEGYYRFGVKMSGPVYYTGNDPHFIYRLYVARDTSIRAFAELLER